MEEAVGRDNGPRIQRGCPADAAEELSANEDCKLDRFNRNQDHERLLEVDGWRIFGLQCSSKVGSCRY